MITFKQFSEASLLQGSFVAGDTNDSRQSYICLGSWGDKVTNYIVPIYCCVANWGATITVDNVSDNAAKIAGVHDTFIFNCSYDWQVNLKLTLKKYSSRQSVQ